MAGLTYKHFTDVYDIPYTIVALLYIGTVLLFTIAVVCSRVHTYCKKKRRGQECESSESTGISKWIEQFNSWLIRLIFGKSEGVSDEDEDEDENIDVRDSGSGKGVYINQIKLKIIDVNILGAIIICFGLLMAINAYSTYLLEVTHTCSEDNAIYCFPQIFNPNSSEFVLLESERMTPITNCSEWTNSSIAPYITFQCFRYALNANAALAVAGGLLALFTFVMRTTISIITFMFKNCKLYNCKPGITVVQVILAIILLIGDVAAAIVVMSFQVVSSLGMLETEVDPVAQQTAAYVADNGIQFVVSTGTIALLLLIPWAYYTDPSNQTQTAQEESSATATRDSPV